MIRHVSFDVWNTLVKPNPEYARLRTKLIADRFDLSEGFVKHSYTQTKQMVDTEAERFGRARSTDEVFELLFRRLDKLNKNSQGVREAVEDLFRKHPPIILDEVRDTIEELRRRNIILSIASNSNFISGNVMLPFLNKELGDFHFALFSDLLLTAKPNKLFFDEVLQQSAFQGRAILHVGDSVLCDEAGAERAGIVPFLVSGPERLPKVLDFIDCQDGTLGTRIDRKPKTNRAPWWLNWFKNALR